MGIKLRYIVNAAEMKAIDSYSITEIGIPSLVLMEKAAMAVVEVMLKHIEKKHKIVCVCGGGNNGGDGIAVARILKNSGFHADILFLGDLEKTTEEVKTQYRIAQNIGVKIFNNLELSEYSIIVDAVFGIGLSKVVEGSFETVINQMNESEAMVYAVDIPSGISADTGKILGTAVKAEETITFGCSKIGLVLFPGCEMAGNVTVADIGFPKEAILSVNPKHFVYEQEDLKNLPCRENYSNKGTFGRVLIIAGSRNMSGACFLSAKAAYRAGAGLVKVLTVESNRSIMQTLLPEALLCTYDPKEIKNKVEVDHILGELEWATTIVMGPGIGVTDASSSLLKMVLKNTKVPTVVDADAINLLAVNEEYQIVKSGTDYGNQLDMPSNIILTPHLKEMSRIMKGSVNEIIDNLLPVARWAVRNKDYILVLKDARTIVADKEKVYLNTSGNNGMATGGCGDVLTGIIAAFLAQGMSNYQAAAMGVYVHGLAADAAAAKKSVYSLMASDIIETLPEVFNS